MNDEKKEAEFVKFKHQVRDTHIRLYNIAADSECIKSLSELLD